jgi:hypothetical protein
MSAFAEKMRRYFSMCNHYRFMKQSEKLEVKRMEEKRLVQRSQG